MRRYRPSRELEAVLGAGVWTKAEISQRMSRYIASRKLTNPDRPGQIRPDAALARVLGTSDPVEMTGLRELFRPHLTQIPDSMPPSVAPKVGAPGERKPEPEAPPISADEFLVHLKDPAPGFLCFSAGDADTALTWATPMHHELARPASPQSLATLEVLLGAKPQALSDLYARHDGMTLYKDIRSDVAGLTLAPVSRWTALTVEVRASFTEEGIPWEKDPQGPLSGVAIATIPQSPDALFFQTKGPLAGSIRLASPGALEDRPLAASFGSLLATLRARPAAFLYRLGCACRYRHPLDSSHWIPAKYVPDIRPHLAQ